MIGVTPVLPGFIAAVNPAVAISDRAVELYYTNYLYGFLSSAVVYYLLHWAVPDRKFDTFVKDYPSARELQQLYNDRWDVSVTQDPERFEPTLPGLKGKGLETVTPSV